jgi:arylsulfatase A-like enzyme
MFDKFNVVFIQIDSLNRHFLSPYGNDWVQTPNLDAFAKRAAVFDNHFVSSAPCMPARREIWTGTQEFWWRGWGPLEPWDIPLAYLAGQAGVSSFLVTDHYHFMEWGAHSYNYDFQGYKFIRGQEVDNWRTELVDEVPDWAMKMVERRGEEALNYLRNVNTFENEDDFFGPKVMRATADWLDRNHNQGQFYLHVDCFDVHEPFHIPEPYRSLYTDDDYRKYNPWPLYGWVNQGLTSLSTEEVEWVRAQYAGKLTMLDTWLGQVFERLDRYNLWDRTCVLLTTDHGHFLGDHQWMGKGEAPMYHTLSHIPLIIWHPQGMYNGSRIGAMTQTLDLYATVLDFLGIEVPTKDYIHSMSLRPLLLGGHDQHRECAVYGYSNDRIGITAGEWTLLRDHDNQAASPYFYTHQVEHMGGIGRRKRAKRLFNFPQITAGNYIRDVEMPVWQMPASSMRILSSPKRPDLLFHNPSDPEQLKNIYQENPDVVRQLENLLRDQMKSVYAPSEQFQRLGL